MKSSQNIDKDNYFDRSNTEVLSISMIETRESVNNLHDILENKSLDMIYLGPYDLSISHGFEPDKVFVEKKMLNIFLKMQKKQNYQLKKR